MRKDNCCLISEADREKAKSAGCVPSPESPPSKCAEGVSKHCSWEGDTKAMHGSVAEMGSVP